MSSPTLELKKIIKAGAGAGKTTTLVNRLYEYFVLFRQVNKKNPKVIVTTFTKKATQELRERLLKKAIQEEDEEFFRVINNKKLIHISTIHGVLHLAIKENLTRLGLRSDLQVISDGEEKHIYHQQIRNLLLSDSSYDDLLNVYSLNDVVDFCVNYYFHQSLDGEITFFLESEYKEKVYSQINEILKDLQHSTEKLIHEKLTNPWQNIVSMYRSYCSEASDITNGIRCLSNWLDTNPKKPTKTKDENSELYWLQNQF
ncbi:MAG: UvrD-helicase domain-containing protein, partial [Bdellovibrionales bacterium]|nr:UvrD-helicase domain-containing protein [Bdellovibrionales bacterium]